MDFNRDLISLQETYKQMVTEEQKLEAMFEINNDQKIGDVNDDGYEIVEIYVSDKNERIAKGIKK